MNMDDRTLIDSLRRQLRERPDALAYRRGERKLSFAHVERATNRIANALAAMGVGRDSRVAVLTKHHIETLLLTLAACKLGAVCMPVNWRLAAPEIAYILKNGEAPFLMADQAFIATVRAADLGSVRTLVCTEQPLEGLQSFEDWYAGHDDSFTPVEADTHDAALQL